MVVTFTLIMSPQAARIQPYLSRLRQARLNQEIARQGFLSFAKYLFSSNPLSALLGGLTVNYISPILVSVLSSQQDVYAFILDVEDYPAQFIAMAICIGTLLLRNSRPDMKRLFKAWPGAIWLRIALNSCIIVAPFIPPKDGRGDVGSCMLLML